MEGLELTREQIRKYWYVEFKKKYDWSLLSVTTHRRKQYEAGQKKMEILRFANYVRDLKLKYGYPPALILNFDETPCWFDMPSKKTLARKGIKSIYGFEIKYF